MEVKYYKETTIEEHFENGKPFLSTVKYIISDVIPCCDEVTEEFMNQLWLLGEDFLMHPKPVGDEWEIVTPHQLKYCEHCGVEIKTNKYMDIVIDEILLLGTSFEKVLNTILQKYPSSKL